MGVRQSDDERAATMGRRRGHGEGSIYQRASDGKWVAALDLGWIAGTRKRKTIYGDTRKEVADKLRKLQYQHSQGVNVAPERMTVETLLRRWLADVVALRSRPGTLTIYTGVVERQLIPVLGRRQLGQLTRQDVQALVAQLSSGGAAPRTVQLAHTCLRSALTQAVEWDLCPRNVADGVTLPRVIAYDARALNIVQIKELILALKGDPLETLYLTTLVLGLRRGEVGGLQWGDINWASNTLRIARGVGVVNKQPVLTETKTARSRRTLPMPEFLADKLAIYEKDQRERGIPTGPGDLVFPGADGAPWYPTLLNGALSKLLKQAGLPHMRFHDLRHSCASLLAALDVQPRYAMAILGHSRISMTMDVYTHVFDETQREVANKLQRLLAPADNE